MRRKSEEIESSNIWQIAKYCKMLMQLCSTMKELRDNRGKAPPPWLLYNLFVVPGVTYNSPSHCVVLPRCFCTHIVFTFRQTCNILTPLFILLYSHLHAGISRVSQKTCNILTPLFILLLEFQGPTGLEILAPAGGFLVSLQRMFASLTFSIIILIIRKYLSPPV